MLTEKFEITVFTLHSKICYNHAFLPMSRKWKARLTALRPCLLNPSWKCFKKKSLRLRKYQERVDSFVIERRILIARCKDERGVP